MIRILPHSPTMGENYIQNPDAEDPLSNHWGSYFGCPRVRSTAEKHGGTASMEYTTNSATNPQGAIVYHARAQATGTFRGTAWVKGTPGQNVDIRLRLNPTSAEVAGAVLTLTGGWDFLQTVPYSITGKAQAPCAPALEVLFSTPNASGRVMYIDDVTVVQTAIT